LAKKYTDKLTFFGKCTGLSLTDVDGRHEDDDVELSSASNGETCSVMEDML